MKEIFEKLESIIEEFPNQFAWNAVVQNEDQLPTNTVNIAICGMGGSALAANLLLSQPKAPNIRIHRDYWHEWLREMDLIILSSFSGNTEEVLDVLHNALEKNIPIAICSNGGELLEIARDQNLAYVALPDAVQPRYAVGYSYIALSKLVLAPVSTQTAESLSEISADVDQIKTAADAVAGKQIVYYSSSQNFATAYVWKILTNESAKQMAWANKLPEFNHNELNGYMTSEKFNLADNLAVITFESDDDHPRNKKRLAIIKNQIRDRGIDVVEVYLPGKNVLEQAVYGWHAGMVFTLELARLNNVNPEAVEIIEDLKRSLRD